MRRIGCLVVALMLVLGGCRRAARAPLTRSTVALDTTVTIAVYDVQASTEVLDDCVQRIQHYESLFSRTRAGSDIYRLNTAGGAWVTVDAETRALMQQALDICRESGGKFDITVAPITSLWNFSSESPVVPDKAALAEAVTHVGYDKLEIDGDRVRLTDPAAGVDLGGVAKGYIADRLREYLVSQKVSGALVDLGGNVLAVGDKQGEAFRVGIRDPQDSAALAATVAVRDRSVVTSGSYERGFTQDGVYYHHILDPASGYPVNNGLAAVTILSEQSVVGDMLSTTCFVLGEEEGLALVERTDGVEALFVRADGTQVTSSGFATVA